MLQQIETSRLTLIRLDRTWMERFSQTPRDTAQALEKELSLACRVRTEHPASAYLYACSEMARFPGGEKWLCFWEVIEKESNGRIGGMLFKGPPDENGDVEIGYGIDEDVRRKGYGLETVKAGIAWAFSQGGRGGDSEGKPWESYFPQAFGTGGDGTVQDDREDAVLQDYKYIRTTVEPLLKALGQDEIIFLCKASFDATF